MAAWCSGAPGPTDAEPPSTQNKYGPLNLYYVQDNLGSSCLLSLDLLNSYLPESVYEHMNLGNIGWWNPNNFPALSSPYLQS